MKRKMNCDAGIRNITEPPEAIPVLPVGWTRCHYYLTSKRRFCRQEPIYSGENTSGDDKGRPRYCGHHRPYDRDRNRTRIPCPYDPTHTIYDDEAEKHRGKCPFLQRRNAMGSLFCYNCNVNSGGHGVLEPDVPPTTVETAEEESLLLPQRGTMTWALQLARRVVEVYDQLFGGENNEIPLVDLSSAELLAQLRHATQHYKIRTGGPHHLHQQASLIGHLQRLVVSESTSTLAQSGSESRRLDHDATQQEGDSLLLTCASLATVHPLVVMEVGAGRGMAGLLAAGALNAARQHERPLTHLILVDRSGSRGKADTVLRRATKIVPLPGLNLNLDWTRVTCDLAHVDLKRLLDSKVTQSSSYGHRLVVIAKHLCGSGTDLALRSLVPVRDSVTECVLATCCHGLCTWDDYVGRSHLSQVMKGDNLKFSFGRREFELLCRWSSGTVCCGGLDSYPSGVPETSNEVDRSSAQHQPADAPPHRVHVDDRNRADEFKIASIVELLQLKCGVPGLGRACQRLIDYGRKEYLRTEIFRKDCVHPPAIVHYVPPSVTPQNALLVASKGRVAS